MSSEPRKIDVSDRGRVAGSHDRAPSVHADAPQRNERFQREGREGEEEAAAAVSWSPPRPIINDAHVVGARGARETKGNY